MLSKNKIRFLAGLSNKKIRDRERLFLAEGTKLCSDLASVFPCRMILATPEWLAQHSLQKVEELIEVSESELRKVSNQKTPQGVLAVFEKTAQAYVDADLRQELSLALDGVQDPGNLGTIVRIADWFGIARIFCSEHCADAFSPKAVQASMGALARVQTYTVKLPEFLSDQASNLPLYAASMDGEDIYDSPLQAAGIVVMGSEGRGLSPEVDALISHKLLIPNFPKGSSSSESLNVSVATALICSEFRRRLR